ncbi:AIF_HP2_G0052110.mRNA.1.CDS.1 [Saccharomyces cerevisiae]|nr:AIF_HP2_G0052110.mRNA.1.CDS.1 [Saccharomyces cerevisiae]CAI6795782.1 AIF_HP2_G0052110.mRNA.1.CDS.1 [Saccharomyces cerevisiae]
MKKVKVFKTLIPEKNARSHNDQKIWIILIKSLKIYQLKRLRNFWKSILENEKDFQSLKDQYEQDHEDATMENLSLNDRDGGGDNHEEVKHTADTVD